MTQPQLQLLGGFRLSNEKGKEISVPGKKTQALLAYLALASGKSHSRDKLATLLWGDRMNEQARHSLRQALSALRKVLNFENRDPLTTDNDAATLKTGILESDVEAFESHAKDGTPQALEEADALYAGPLLDGLRIEAEEFDHWLAGERQRLHTLAYNALEQLARHQEIAGKAEKALETAKRLVFIDPAREEGHQLLIRLWAQRGRRSEALRQYQACVDALRRELDVEPSPETTRLYEQVRSGELAEDANRSTIFGHPWPSDALPSLPDKPSIAVLPFENMSGDPEQEYFSDGLAEDIITDLSKLSGLFVIARKSSFSYRGKTATIGQIGQELGVRHILEGSVRKAGNQVRVTAQLVEAATGTHMWAERYDRSLDGLFEVQDEITDEVVTALDVELVQGEQARIWRKSYKNPKAREFFYRARESFNHLTRESQAQARELFTQAIEAEPESPLGYVRQAWSHWYDAFRGWGDSPEQSLLLADDLAQDALSRDANNPEAHITKALIHIAKKEFEQAVAEGERAVMLGPNMADVAAFRGMIYYFVGRYEEALASMQRAMRLCPVCPAYYLVFMGQSLNLLERYEEAVRSFQNAAQMEPDYPTSYFGLAVAHGALNHKDQARSAAKTFRNVAPYLPSLQEYARRHPFMDQSAVEKWIDVLKNTDIE